MQEQESQKRFVVTERDRAILRSIGEVRYLTAEQVEWLHFPTWRERWQRIAEQGNAARYTPNARVYERLKGLHQLGFLHRVYRPVALAVDQFQRAPDLFYLSRRGAEYVSHRCGIALDELHYGEPRLSSAHMLTHGAEIGRVYAALRAQLEVQRGYGLTDWQGDHRTAKSYDRIQVRVPVGQGAIRQQKLAVQPDGVLTLVRPKDSWLCFVEVERDRPLKAWKQKVYAFEGYRLSQVLGDRYGRETFLVLAIVETPHHRQRLLEATAEALVALGRANSIGVYLVMALEDVHPHRIGTHWHRVSKVVPVSRSRIGGGTTTTIQMETEQFPLF
jgi:hypothetical protein